MRIERKAALIWESGIVAGEAQVQVLLLVCPIIALEPSLSCVLFSLSFFCSRQQPLLPLPLPAHLNPFCRPSRAWWLTPLEPSSPVPKLNLSTPRGLLQAAHTLPTTAPFN
jgi:hypothetical protein